MYRRRFLKFLALSSTAAIAPLKVVQAAAGKTVSYRVKGFSCITCAVGLDTLLHKHRGIISSKSTYPEGKVIVSFDPAAITENAIQEIITEMGFSAERE